MPPPAGICGGGIAAGKGKLACCGQLGIPTGAEEPTGGAPPCAHAIFATNIVAKADRTANVHAPRMFIAQSPQLQKVRARLSSPVPCPRTPVLAPVQPVGSTGQTDRLPWSRSDIA